MGKVYFPSREQFSQVPMLEEQRPDVLEVLSFEELQTGLKKLPGEIKGVFTKGGFPIGIENAYSDEILFAAGLSSFRKAGCISNPEPGELYEQCIRVANNGIEVLSTRPWATTST